MEESPERVFSISLGTDTTVVQADIVTIHSCVRKVER